MRILVLLMAPVLLALSATVGAQPTGVVAGVVRDDLGEPIPVAEVIIGGVPLGASTDIDGRYRIVGVPVGSYDVTVSHYGFAMDSVRVSVAAGDTLAVPFTFRPMTDEELEAAGWQIIRCGPRLSPPSTNLIEQHDLESVGGRGTARATSASALVRVIGRSARAVGSAEE